MLEAKVSWLLCIGRLVSKTENVMHFAQLVKQPSVDSVSDWYLFRAYINFITLIYTKFAKTDRVLFKRKNSIIKHGYKEFLFYEV